MAAETFLNKYSISWPMQMNCDALNRTGAEHQTLWSQKSSLNHNPVLIIIYFMHTVHVLSPATNMSIQRWYNKTTCGSHYSTNELSPWQSDLSANEASSFHSGGDGYVGGFWGRAWARVSQAAARDEGPAGST